MRSKILVLVMLGMVIFGQGCATMKGAKEGFKEDWKALQKADDWMKENLW
jgi:hypothetical protein